LAIVTGKEDKPTSSASFLIQASQNEVSESVKKVLVWNFDKIILAHGELVRSHAKHVVRSAYAWAINAQNDNNSKKEDLSEISMKLNQTLEKVSELIEKKKILENHINFAEKMKKELELRKIGKIYDFEYDLMSNRGINNEIKKNFNDILNSSNHQKNLLSNNDFKYDILRACLIYYMVHKDMSPDELSNLEKNLTNNYQVKLSSLEFLKQKRSFDEGMKIGGSEKSQSSGIFGKLKNKSYGLLSSFGSLMSIKQPCLSADILDTLSNNKDVANFVNYNFLKRSTEKVNPNQNFSQVIVFFVGGGSLAEYEYLDQLFTKNNKNIIYGCDHLYSPREFVECLEQLNKGD